MIKDSEALETLVPVLIQLLKDDNKQQELKNNIGKLAISNADEIIATEILKLI